MTSYKSFTKMLLVSLALSVGIGVSVFSTISDSQASSHQQKLKTDSYSQAKALYAAVPKSDYERKLRNDIKRLMPGDKHFNPNFLANVLAYSDNQREV